MSHEDPYFPGQRILLTTKDLPFQKRTSGGVWTLADPTTIKLWIRKGDGTTESFTFAAGELTKISTGVYEREVVPEVGQEGRWYFGFEGDGNVETYSEGSFYVAPRKAA
jgi:hypothetical protein